MAEPDGTESLAAASNGVVSRRPKQDDVQYLICDHDPVSRLSDTSLLAIGLKLSVERPNRCDWKRAAEELSVSKLSITGIEAARGTNPGYELLDQYRMTGDSSILVLKNVFANMDRDDLLDMIDNARRDETTVTVVVMNSDHGETVHDLSGKCPGGKPLSEYVRTTLSRKFGYKMTQHINRTVLRLKKMTSTEFGELGWTSPVRHFKGKHISLTLVMSPMNKTSAQAKCRSEPPPECSGVDRRGRERLVTSLIDADLIYFDNELEEDDRQLQLQQHPGADDINLISTGGNVDDEVMMRPGRGRRSPVFDDTQQPQSGAVDDAASVDLAAASQLPSTTIQAVQEVTPTQIEFVPRRQQQLRVTVTAIGDESLTTTTIAVAETTTETEDA